MAPPAHPIARVSRGLVILAVLASMGLLSGYVHVLNGAVRRGELHHIAMADHAKSAWRCNALPLDADQKQCLMRLNAVLREVP